MLKKIWKKTMHSAAVFNNRLLNNFRCRSKYAKISPENGDNFMCTVEEQKFENKTYQFVREKSVEFRFASITNKKEKQDIINVMIKYCWR